MGFIATDLFTAEARREAVRDGASAIDLTDGSDLIERLGELELGVRITEKTVREYVVDTEWFGRV